MTKEIDVRLPDGRTLHAYDTGAGRLTVCWHHGTPNLGAPPRPLFPTGDALGVRWISYDRPGYGGSTPRPGRDIASAAADTAAVADALGVSRFAVLGHSGGGPHALACAALLGSRVTAVVSIAGLAPHDTEGLDWYAGMADGCAESLRVAAAGRPARKLTKPATRARPPSPTPTGPPSPANGPGSARSSTPPSKPAPPPRSTTTWPTWPPGTSPPPTSAPPSTYSTATRTA